MNRILVTGAAGFIGFHLSRTLLDSGHEVVGEDNLNDYYDVGLKRARLGQLEGAEGCSFRSTSPTEGPWRASCPPEASIWSSTWARRRGIRYSIVRPYTYVDSNVKGFLNVLEGCRHSNVGHLVFASSSSVYGANTKMPFSEHDRVDHPVSLYGATKRANELLANSYASLYGLPCTRLRIFTVYGPWGTPRHGALPVYSGRRRGGAHRCLQQREDEARFHLHRRRGGRNCARNAQSSDGRPRVEPRGARRCDLLRPLSNIQYRQQQPCRAHGVHPYDRGGFGKKAKLNMLPMQPGDVKATYADVSDLERDVEFRPGAPVGDGMRKFIEW